MRAKFEYLAPTSLDEACGVLQEHGGDAKLLAGGTALVMWLRMGLLSPGYVINLENVPGLDGITLFVVDATAAGVARTRTNLVDSRSSSGTLSGESVCTSPAILNEI